jgi:metal-sulfur cluster biosynthetic enzyme
VVVTVDDVTEALRQVFDPELGLDIVELGLLYDVQIVGDAVTVIYSLTSIGCPAGPLLNEQILEAVSELPGVERVELQLTWDPPWTPERMSEDAKLLLGFGY